MQTPRGTRVAAPSPPEFHRYGRAFPDTDEDPYGGTRYRPPPRCGAFARQFGPGPNKWCGTLTAGGSHIPPATVNNDAEVYPTDISSPTEDKSTSKSTSSTPNPTLPSQHADGHAIVAIQKVTDSFLVHLQGEASNPVDKEGQQHASVLAKAKASDSPELVKEPDATELGEWDITMRPNLSNAAWEVDGIHILSMDDGGDLTDAFELRVTSLWGSPVVR